MTGFCSENSKSKVCLIAKQISLRMNSTKALHAVHTSQLKPAQLVWYRILRANLYQGCHKSLTKFPALSVGWQRERVRRRITKNSNACLSARKRNHKDNIRTGMRNYVQTMTSPHYISTAHVSSQGEITLVIVLPIVVWQLRIFRRRK